MALKKLLSNSSNNFTTMNHTINAEGKALGRIASEAAALLNAKDSIHFVKNRAEVDIYLRNHSRKRETNETEIMEVVRLIEPLIVSRVSFYE